MFCPQIWSVWTRVASRTGSVLVLRVHLEEAEQPVVLVAEPSAAAVSLCWLCPHRLGLTVPEGSAWLRPQHTVAPPSARSGPAAGLHLGHQQAEGISSQSDQLSTSEGGQRRETAPPTEQPCTSSRARYSRVVVQAHQADPVHSQDPVPRLQALTLGCRRTRNQRPDVDSAHPQRSPLRRKRKMNRWLSCGGQRSEVSPSRPPAPGPAREDLCAAPR